MLYSIVIPVFNEEKNIISLIEEIEEVRNKINEEVEVIIIDDGSTDNTKNVIKEKIKNRYGYKLIVLNKNYGQTPAIYCGIKEAKGGAIILMDGDGQNDPNDIPSLIEKYKEGFDLISGWRKKRKDPYFSRILPSRIANWLISFITGVKLHDYGCSLKIYNAELLKGLKIFGEMHRFLPAYVVWKGGKYIEVEVNHRPRIFGKSNYNLSRIFKVLLDLITAKFMFSYLTKPIYFFGGLGLITNLISFILIIFILIRKYFLKGEWISPLFFISIFGILLGINFILIGILGELIIRIYFSTSNEETYKIQEKFSV